MSNEQDQKEPKQFPLTINKKPYKWAEQFINGAQIKELSESPKDWIVNQIVPGPGEDPEIKDDQKVDLDQKAQPPGEKKFTTRKPATSPGQ